MAVVTKLRDATLAKPVPKPDGLLLPQACRSSAAVRGLARTADVVRLSRQIPQPELMEQARAKLLQLEERLLVKLPVSVWYGAFHLRGKVRVEGRLRYAATCACGNECLLTSEELVMALVEHTGCQQSCCQQKTVLRLFWGSMAESMAVQWKLIQACYPERLPSYWGGTLDTVYERDLKYGFVRAYQDMLRFRVDPKKPDFRWITPLNPELPFTLDNIELTLFPWGGIAKLNKLAPVIAGQPIQIHDLCESLNVTVEQVLEALINDDVDPDQLISALLQKGANK